LSGLFAFSLVTLHTVDNMFGVDNAWKTWLVANGMDKFFELRSSELKLTNFLAMSAALPLILLFNLMTTERSFFGVLAALTHGSIIATWGNGGTARMSAAKHVLASFVVFLVCEAVKLIKAGAQLRKWRSDIKNLEALAGAEKEGRRVLILYANVGSGHKSAANAVDDALSEIAPDVTTQKLDLFDVASPAFKFAAQTMFQKMTQSLAGQHSLGLLYDLGDHGNEKAKFQRVMEDLAGSKLVNKIAEFRPDTIVCTHFLPAQLVASIKAASEVIGSRVKLGLVITDLDLQSMWMQERAVDVYFLPRDASAIVLSDYEAKAEELRQKKKKKRPSKLKAVSKKVVSGIPISPRFTKAVELKQSDNNWLHSCYDIFNLDKADKRPVVTIMSGGSKIEALFARALAVKTPLRFVVVMGRQADIREKLSDIVVPSRHSVELVGFCKEMPKLLAVTDVMLGKCGGLTAAENAAMGVPLIIPELIPGQESRNADVLLEAGAALKVNDLALVTAKLEAVVKEGGRLEKLKVGMRSIAKPNSPYTVANEILHGNEKAWRGGE